MNKPDRRSHKFMHSSLEIRTLKFRIGKLNFQPNTGHELLAMLNNPKTLFLFVCIFLFRLDLIMDFQPAKIFFFFKYIVYELKILFF
jgi:hypothetical protein